MIPTILIVLLAVAMLLRMPMLKHMEMKCFRCGRWDCECQRGS